MMIGNINPKGVNNNDNDIDIDIDIDMNIKERIIILYIFLMSFMSINCCFSQSNNDVSVPKSQFDQLSEEINSLKKKSKAQDKEISMLNEIILKQQMHIDSLELQVKDNEKNVSSSIDSMNVAKQGMNIATMRLTSVVNTKFMLAIALALIAIILALSACIIYRKKTKKSNKLVDSFSDNISQLKTMQKSLESKLTDADSKTIELLEKNIEIASKVASQSKEQDHSLAIAVANELTRIQQNLNYMDSSVKGVSQLKNRAKALITTLNSRQYDIPEMLGREYHEGDNIVATMEYNEDLEPGTNRIKRVIKPQVSYMGKLIQAAEVVVEFNDD
ncbi:MAG: hypothetical protein LUC91_03850 [Prevotella sp.]|nr:hypothetical protein [Prevotella sp.]